MAMLPLLSLNAQASQRFFNLTYDQVRIDSVLPRFTYSLPLADNYADSVYQVSIVYPEFTEMSRAEVARYKHISDAPLPAMPAIRQFVSFDRKRPTLVVSFLPLVFRDGRYSILASFMLKVESFATAHAKPRSGILPTRTAADRYARQSVLAQGRWVKIRIPASGVYQQATFQWKRARFMGLKGCFKTPTQPLFGLWLLFPYAVRYAIFDR